MARDSDFATAYQINPAHSGNITLSTGFATPLRRAWSRIDLGTMSYALIADGKVFVIGTDKAPVLYALSLSTGKTLWNRSLNAENVLGPTYDRGDIFVLGTNGVVDAFVGKSGALLWSDVLNTSLFEYNADPTATHGQLLISAATLDGAVTSGALAAINETNGELQWAQGVEYGSDSSPSYGDYGIYVSYPYQYYKFAPSGYPTWHDGGGAGGGGGATPIFYKNKVFVQDYASHNPILDAKTGQLLGNFPSSQDGQSPAFLTIPGAGDFGLTARGGGSLACWSVPSGHPKWAYTGSYVTSSPIVVNGRIVVGSDRGEIDVLDNTGETLWSGTARGGTPIISLSAGQGTLIAISTYTTYPPANASISAFVPS